MKDTKGITLIALIITIIVMLILVGVTVTTAINGGLFTAAQEAKKQYKIAYIIEQINVAIVNSWDEFLLKYDEQYLQNSGVSDPNEDYNNYREFGVTVGKYGTINIGKLQKELEKIFETEIKNGEVIITSYCQAEDAFTDSSYETLYNYVLWYDYIATGDAKGKEDNYIRNKYEEIFGENAPTLTEDDVQKIKNATGFYAPESAKSLGAEFKMLGLDLTVIKLTYEDKIITINSAGEIINKEFEETTIGWMRREEADKVFEWESTQIKLYKGNSKILKIPSAIGTEMIFKLGKYETNANAGDYWSLVFSNYQILNLSDPNFIEFKEDNLQELKDAYKVPNTVNTFDELIVYLHAYKENEKWYAWYKLEENNPVFIDKPVSGGVEKVVISNSVELIEEHAFSYDPFLNSVWIPKNLISQNYSSDTGIKANAFEGASPDLKIYIENPGEWRETEKLNKISEFSGLQQAVDAGARIIWSDEAEYVKAP